MKKILSIALVAVMTLNMMSCNEKGGANKSTPLQDSVSMTFGDLVGASIANHLKEDSTSDANQVIKGIEMIMRADTSNHSYIAGLQIGMQMLQQLATFKQQFGLELDRNKFLAHFKKALLADSTMTQEQLMALNMAFEPLMDRAVKEAKANDPRAIENKKSGEAFINKKAADKAYKKTASGLVYKVITEGKGANFTENDVVMTKYVGKHIDGSEFDSSRGEAIPFNLKAVVPGFAEMIKLMKPGSKVEVVIPGALAYGEEGKDPVIGPNETLVFEIETIEVQKVQAGDGREVPVQATAQ